MQSRLTGGMPAKLSQGPRTGYDLSRMGAGAARGFNGKKKLEAAPWSNTWPAPGATLDLDFANNRGFVRGLGQGGVMDGITFTRASNATYVGEDGLLKGYTQGGTNLLTFPQDFDNAAWGKVNVTVSANAIAAPDGTSTADKLIGTTVTGVHEIVQSGTVDASQNYTYSFYAKASEYSFVQILFLGNSTYVNFNLSDGSISAGTAGFGDIFDAGNGWWRCSISLTPPGTTLNTYIHLIPSGTAGRNAGFTGDGTSGIYIWGAQLELGSTATEYFPTNINVPRFDWAGTDVIQPRNKLIGAATTATGGAYVAPTGTGTRFTRQSLGSFAGYVPEDTTHTVTVEVKANGASSAALSFNSNSGVAAGIAVNFSTGETSTFNFSGYVVGLTTSAEDLGGGWWRLVATTTSNAFWNACSVYMSTTASFDAAAPVGDGTSGVLYRNAALVVGTTITPHQEIGSQAPTHTPLRPTPTCNGLLIEAARTNRLLWCRDATDAAWVKTDITAAKDQTGIDGVANAASSLTATAANGTCIQTITLASGSCTGSVYLKRLTGTGIVQVSLDGTTWSTVELSDTEWRRIVLSGTVTNPAVGIRLATSGDAVAMDFAQVEDGGFVTTPILTTGASATRSVDFATINTIIFDRIADHRAVSFKAKFVCRGSPSGDQHHVFGYGNTAVSGIFLWMPNNTTAIQFGSTSNPNLAQAIALGAPLNMAGAYSPYKSCLAYQRQIQIQNKDVLPGGAGSLLRPLLLSIGSNVTGGRQLNGTVSSLTLINGALNESVVEELSA